MTTKGQQQTVQQIDLARMKPRFQSRFVAPVHGTVTKIDLMCNNDYFEMRRFHDMPDWASGAISRADPLSDRAVMVALFKNGRPIATRYRTYDHNDSASTSEDQNVLLGDNLVQVANASNIDATGRLLIDEEILKVTSKIPGTNTIRVRRGDDTILPRAKTLGKGPQHVPVRYVILVGMYLLNDHTAIASSRGSYMRASLRRGQWPEDSYRWRQADKSLVQNFLLKIKCSKSH